MSIEDIVQGCKEGNRKCQEALVRKYAPGLLAICNRYMADVHQAQDVLQDKHPRLAQGPRQCFPQARASGAQVRTLEASLNQG